MSRNNVGELYAKVIKDVCEQSRVDFEEGGVELATLDLLQQEWQKKLSQLKVAQLPWDPTPTPAKEPTVPSTTKPPSQTLPSNANPINTPPQSHHIPSLPPIKQENVYQPQPPATQNYAPPSFPQGLPQSAEERAAMNLHHKFGQTAGAQIAQLQQSGTSRVPVSKPMPGGPPLQSYIKQEDQKSGLPSLEEYRPPMQQGSPPIKNSQVDGAADGLEEWKAEYTRRKSLVGQNRSRGDRLIREHFLATQQQLEGGGLLLPLEERRIVDKSVRRMVNTRKQTTPQATVRPDSSVCTPAESASLHRAQGDAAGDDDEDEDDENAINSDLDDPDELDVADENDENIGEVMLCTYDKVQRVKNKWKCTLKDGVLRVGGSEYVFHKGQGEFEW